MLRYMLSNYNVHVANSQVNNVFLSLKYSQGEALFGGRGVFCRADAVLHNV